ncbi:hypothetical protein CBR_g61260, partial [Chara braunii]
MYKMPTFNLERFDDYTQHDPVLWWEAFTTQLRILLVAKHAYIGALFVNSKGGCQTWLSHLATSHGVDVPDLKDKITWEELTRLWKKRFIVDDAPTLAINRLFTMSQGNTATRDWLTEWQKIAAVPNLKLPFTHLRREFYNRSCAALSQALGDREQYSTFAEIIDKAREIIKTNRSAAHERSTWQPTYVEKVRTGPRQQHFAAVQRDSGDNPAATPASSDGDQVAAVQPRSNNKSRSNGKAKSASQAENGQPVQVPWIKFGLTEAEYKLGKLSSAEGEATPPSTPPDSAALLAASCTSEEDANVACSRYTYEDYTVHLVPPLDQPLHVQLSTGCTVSSPSATDSAASPPSIVRDSSSWSTLEVLDPLTFTDFQWMPVPPTERLPKLHCNVLVEQQRDYLHTAVPTPFKDAGVEVVDLHVYIVKIDREFKMQRYDDMDTPLLYVRIQIGEATCSALIDCGASRNYISQDFMVRAGLGPRVRRKPKPMQVTLADGHTHKSIDRCIDSLPMYFAPHASEAVSFDILDTKFDMILGMSWLRSKDHPVNFFNRTVHVRRIFTDLLLPRPADIDAACSPASVRKYRELLTQARANMQKAQVRMQQQANRRRVPCPIRVGDLVWVSSEEFAREQDVSRKLLPKWFGPWSVTTTAGDEPDGPSFVINILEHLTVHLVFHASKLATYTPAKSDDFPDRRSQDPPSMDGHQEVDRVISDRKYSNKPRQYKVTFKARDRDDTRWISGPDLIASAPLIYAHYEKRRLAQEASRPALPTRTVVPPSDRQLRLR